MAYRCRDDEPFLVPYGPLDKSNCEIRDSLEFARGIYNCISHLIATSCPMPGRQAMYQPRMDQEQVEVGWHFLCSSGTDDMQWDETTTLL